MQTLDVSVDQKLVNRNSCFLQCFPTKPTLAESKR